MLLLIEAIARPCLQMVVENTWEGAAKELLRFEIVDMFVFYILLVTLEEALRVKVEDMIRLEDMYEGELAHAMFQGKPWRLSSFGFDLVARKLLSLWTKSLRCC